MSGKKVSRIQTISKGFKSVDWRGTHEAIYMIQNVFSQRL